MSQELRPIRPAGIDPTFPRHRIAGQEARAGRRSTRPADPAAVLPGDPRRLQRGRVVAGALALSALLLAAAASPAPGPAMPGPGAVGPPVVPVSVRPLDLAAAAPLGRVAGQQVAASSAALLPPASRIAYRPPDPTDPPAATIADPATRCEAAAARATRVHDLPPDILRAIALVETGQDRGQGLRPWPWAVHAHGRGHWFPTRAAAEDFLATVPPSPHGIDIGCFQINTRWHGAAFDGPAAMLDPEAGADHAARFLRRLHDRLGDWDAAVGAYHSRQPDLATRYLARYRDARALLAAAGPGRPGHAPPPAPPPRTPAAVPVAAANPAGTLTGGIPWR